MLQSDPWPTDYNTLDRHIARIAGIHHDGWFRPSSNLNHALHALDKLGQPWMIRSEPQEASRIIVQVGANPNKVEQHSLYDLRYVQDRRSVYQMKLATSICEVILYWKGRAECTGS